MYLRGNLVFFHGLYDSWGTAMAAFCCVFVFSSKSGGRQAGCAGWSNVCCGGSAKELEGVFYMKTAVPLLESESGWLVFRRCCLSSLGVLPEVEGTTSGMPLPATLRPREHIGESFCL